MAETKAKPTDASVESVPSLPPWDPTEKKL